MKPTSPARTRRRQGGNELVEFAVALPCLAMLMMVIGQVSGAVATHQTLNNAAREGARLATVPGEYGNSSDVQNRVIAYAAAHGITLAAANISVNQDLVVPQSGGACSVAAPCLKASRVSVTYNYPLDLLLGKTLQLGTAVEMRNLY